MEMTGNTILITGGGSGIGRALAESFHALGNRVIIAGRGQKALDDVVAANPGMTALIVDMTDATSINELAAQAVRAYPTLNALINNAGIMRPEDVLNPAGSLADAEATIATNLLGPIRLTAALLPTFRRQGHATIINVSSGLASVPLAITPTYCATKAAIHSYTQSLRHQLRDTAVEVLELTPPYVATSLMGEHQVNDPAAMPLDAFIAEVMEIMKGQPTPPEICVQRVHPLRFAAEHGKDGYDRMFGMLNGASAHAQTE